MNVEILIQVLDATRDSNNTNRNNAEKSLLEVIFLFTFYH